MLTVAMLALLASCGGSTAPTTPSVAPTPATTPVASGCAPAPPLSAINVSATTGANYWTVATAFLVGPDATYCAAVGFTDGRSFCPLRLQGASVCELSRIGIAEDTGLPGPTWTLTRSDGTATFCSGPDAGCEHTADPFQINAYVSGVYRACIADASCGWISVDRSH
jgi:hypothetical protein